MRSLWNTFFTLLLLFYFISDAFSPLLWPKQNAAEPYVERSQPIRVNGSHDGDFTHENKIVHYFHCVGDASASKENLIGGDGKGNVFCRNLFSPLKALCEFYFTNLWRISLLFAVMHEFYFLCRSCAGILFSYLPATFKKKMVRH